MKKMRDIQIESFEDLIISEANHNSILSSKHGIAPYLNVINSITGEIVDNIFQLNVKTGNCKFFNTKNGEIVNTKLDLSKYHIVFKTFKS